MMASQPSFEILESAKLNWKCHKDRCCFSLNSILQLLALLEIGTKEKWWGRNKSTPLLLFIFEMGLRMEKVWISLLFAYVYSLCAPTCM